MVEMCESMCKERKDRIAFSCMGLDLSYAELDKQSSNFANYLYYLELKKGDRVAIMMPNLLQYVIGILGCLKAGMIVVNTNPLYTVREMKH
jgi:long-chain acyl-CoA synthetase